MTTPDKTVKFSQIKNGSVPAAYRIPVQYSGVRDAVMEMSIKDVEEFSDLCFHHMDEDTAMDVLRVFRLSRKFTRQERKETLELRARLANNSSEYREYSFFVFTYSDFLQPLWFNEAYAYAENHPRCQEILSGPVFNRSGDVFAPPLRIVEEGSLLDYLWFRLYERLGVKGFFDVIAEAETIAKENGPIRWSVWKQYFESDLPLSWVVAMN